jgi:phosphohistidine swiveling domain-containing protein
MPKFEKFLTRKYSFFSQSLIFAIWADYPRCMALTGIPDYVSNIEFILDAIWADATWIKAVAQKYKNAPPQRFWDFFTQGYGHGEALKIFSQETFQSDAALQALQQPQYLEIFQTWCRLFQNDFAFVFITHPLSQAVVLRTGDILQAKGVRKEAVLQIILNLSVAKKPNGPEQEERDLWQIKQNMPEPGFDLEGALRDHCQQYAYLAYREPFAAGYPLEYFRNRLDQIKPWEEPSLQYPEVISQFSPQELAYIQLLDEFVFYRTYRTEKSYEAMFYMEKFLAKLESEFGLAEHDLSFYSYEEIERLLKNSLHLEPALMHARKSGFAMLLHDSTISIKTGNEAAQLMAARNLKKPRHKKVAHGMVVSRGQAHGPVKVVMDASELGIVEDGDILIAPMTTPDYLPALQKAAAFVTDEGGMTCHAAIVAREMKKPCIIGTKNATEVFNNGDMVDVDAVMGIVTIADVEKIK